MSSPLLQLTLTIDEASIGKLLQAALMLHARIDALGLIEAVPYTKNVPAQLREQLGHKKTRVRKDDNTILQSGESVGEYKARKQRAHKAFVEAVAAAGSEGLDREAARKVYAAAGGDLRGFGNVARYCAVEKRNRLFPDAADARAK